MFGHDGGIKTKVSEKAGTMRHALVEAADAAVEYVDPLARDEKLRQRVAAAVAAGNAARRRARRQAGLTGLAARLGSDPVLRAQLAEMAAQLQAANKRAKRAHSHNLRNTVLFLGGVGMVIAAVPSTRATVMSKFRGRRDHWAQTGSWDHPTPKPTTIDEEIEVDVPVATAYNQWTQFEEFPRFMEGVDEVRQLDDSLLHWAATVGGKRAEWDAKIIEQERDRRVAWESIDGKQTRGMVTFEEAGPGRSRIRLHMSYTPEGVAEKVGSGVGLDKRRVRGDLQRFRELIEAHQPPTG
jgi:uncharacterized membrane protein